MAEFLINLDLHGGDFAPLSVLEGANIALKKNPSIRFQLHSTKFFYEEYKKKFPELFFINLNNCFIFSSCKVLK